MIMLNNINLMEMERFYEEVKGHPEVAKKTKKVIGEWNFNENDPQFKATLACKEGERVIESDLAPFMGGQGLAPDPIQYCLYGIAACFAGTFVSLAAQEKVQLSQLRVIAENKVDLSRSLGLSNNPVVEKVSITVQVKSSSDGEKLENIKKMAYDRCPGIYCLTHSIPLDTNLEQI